MYRRAQTATQGFWPDSTGIWPLETPRQCQLPGKNALSTAGALLQSSAGLEEHVKRLCQSELLKDAIQAQHRKKPNPQEQELLTRLLSTHGLTSTLGLKRLQSRQERWLNFQLPSCSMHDGRLRRKKAARGRLPLRRSLDASHNHVQAYMAPQTRSKYGSAYLKRQDPRKH